MKLAFIIFMLAASCFGMSEQGFENWPYETSSLGTFTNDSYLGWKVYNSMCRGDVTYEAASGSTNRAIWFTRGTFFNSKNESCLISPVITNTSGIVHLKYLARNKDVTANSLSVYSTYSLDPSTNYASGEWNLVQSNTIPSMVFTPCDIFFTNSIFRIMIRKSSGSSFPGIDRVEIQQPYEYQPFSSWPIGDTNYNGWSVGGGPYVFYHSNTNNYNFTTNCVLYPSGANNNGYLQFPTITNGLGKVIFYHRVGATWAIAHYFELQKQLPDNSWSTLAIGERVTNIWTKSELTINEYGTNTFRLLMPGTVSGYHLFLDDISFTLPPPTVSVSSVSCSGIQGELYPVGTANISATVTTNMISTFEALAFTKINGVTSSNPVPAGSTVSDSFTPASRMQTNEYWFQISYESDEWGNTTTVESAHGNYVTPPVYPKAKTSLLMEW